MAVRALEYFRYTKHNEEYEIFYKKQSNVKKYRALFFRDCEKKSVNKILL